MLFCSTSLASFVLTCLFQEVAYLSLGRDVSLLPRSEPQEPLLQEPLKESEVRPALNGACRSVTEGVPLHRSSF